MNSKEAKARIKINGLLEQSGWRFFDSAEGKANISLEHRIKKGKFTNDNLGIDLENAPDGFIDYLLLNEQSRSVALVEAKRESIDPLTAKEQTREYARAQNIRHIFLSNGNVHYYWDLEQGKPDMPKVLIKPRKEFARLDAYKAQTAGFSLIRKQYEKCRALETEIKGLVGAHGHAPKTGGPPSAPTKPENQRLLARLQTAFAKQTAEFFKIADVKYDKIVPPPLTPVLSVVEGGGSENPIQNFFDTRLKEAVIAYGADRSHTGNLSFPLRKHLDEQREYNLSFDRYAQAEKTQEAIWKHILLRDICLKVLSGGTPTTENSDYWNGDLPWITSADIKGLRQIEVRKYITQKGLENSAINLLPKGSILVVTRVGLGKLALTDFDVCISQDLQGLVIDTQNVMAEFVLLMLSGAVQIFKQQSRGITIQGVTRQQLLDLEIPLPPLETQKQIVAEIEVYQKSIEAAKQQILDAEANIRATIGLVWGEKG